MWHLGVPCGGAIVLEELLEKGPGNRSLCVSASCFGDFLEVIDFNGAGNYVEERKKMPRSPFYQLHQLLDQRQPEAQMGIFPWKYL